ncbi:hypothetical protein HPP92_017236 [Vanilla planifolia]|uniref:Uncharacterized protein n=1 Tax=Vanilla planifolia TaxID=51239 RepID=A0A835QGN6_VANPL|nr:hypothetical protein HPP92_017236 [Vanilla planifolia]
MRPPALDLIEEIGLVGNPQEPTKPLPGRVDDGALPKDMIQRVPFWTERALRGKRDMNLLKICRQRKCIIKQSSHKNRDFFRNPWVPHQCVVMLLMHLRKRQAAKSVVSSGEGQMTRGIQTPP